MTLNQIGTVLVFKLGTPRDQIAAALRQLEPLLEPKTMDIRDAARYGLNLRDLVPAADNRTVLAVLNSFNPDHGSPVFYVP